MPIRGAVPVDDPASAATLRAVLDELVDDDFVYRYLHDDRPPAAAEGAFLLCGFVAALAMQQAGNPVQARAFYERSRSACGSAGLFSEEYDVRQRQQRGNLPQGPFDGLARAREPWSWASAYRNWLTASSASFKGRRSASTGRQPLAAWRVMLSVLFALFMLSRSSPTMPLRRSRRMRLMSRDTCI